jgi:hypothetical protein
MAELSLPDDRSSSLPTAFSIVLVIACIVALAAPARGDEKLAGIACRSVHLQFPAPEGNAFYNEVVVDKSAEGTYFCVCGFRHGYYGVQELAPGRRNRDAKKVLIFSVWDPGSQNDPNQVDDEERVKLLYKDEAVRVGRFGNEGTGGQSFLDLDWQPGQTYRFLVTSAVDGKRTAFTAWLLASDDKLAGGDKLTGGDKEWRKLVTFSTLTGGKPLSGYYSFVEDFRRNRVSTEHAREARFGNGWVRDLAGKWHPLAQARFTADTNPVVNINAGQRDGWYFLSTGGETKNDATPLRGMIELAADAKREMPAMPAEISSPPMALTE